MGERKRLYCGPFSRIYWLVASTEIVRLDLAPRRSWYVNTSHSQYREMWCPKPLLLWVNYSFEFNFDFPQFLVVNKVGNLALGLMLVIGLFSLLYQSIGCNSSRPGGPNSESLNLKSAPSAHSPLIKSSLSSFGAKTLGRGQSMDPVFFEIAHSDPSVDLNALLVEVESSDIDVINHSNIIIDTSDPAICSVVVRHGGEQLGDARIKVSVSDPFGVKASTSFLVSVRDETTN